MGCCKSKQFNYFKNDKKLEFTDKKTQVSRLVAVLTNVESEIDKLKRGVMTFNLRISGTPRVLGSGTLCS